MLRLNEIVNVKKSNNCYDEFQNVNCQFKNTFSFRVIFLPNPGTSKLNTKHRVANGIGKIGIAAVNFEFFTISFGSIAIALQGILEDLDFLIILI